MHFGPQNLKVAGSLRVPSARATASHRFRRNLSFLADGTGTVPAALCWAVLVVLGGIVAPAAQAQLRVGTPSSQFELSETVQLDRADGAALAHLERAKACLAEHQWDEAVETLRQVMENAEGKLLAVTPWRYVNLSDACQMQLAALPPEALRALSPPRRSRRAEVVRRRHRPPRREIAQQRRATGLRQQLGR